MPNRARRKVASGAVTRAQAVAEFGRKKARAKRQSQRRRIILIIMGALASYALIGGWWLAYSGKFERATQEANHWFWRQTAAVGFRLDQVTLEGRTHSDVAAVKAALAIRQGDPILAVPLADMKVRLEAIAEVRSVHITRRLPNELTITIAERTPVAWWQKDGQQRLVDAEGVVLNRDKYPEKLALPVVVGEDAPRHVAELMGMLKTAPSIRPDVVAAVRVGGRRWNVELAHEVVVMLPETNPASAWKRFAGLVEKEALLSKAIRSVDMRMEDRVFIMPVEQQQSPITLTSARDT